MWIFLVFFWHEFIEQQNFERRKNGEDGSDFQDFWTKSIVSTQSMFKPPKFVSKIFGSLNNFTRMNDYHAVVVVDVVVKVYLRFCRFDQLISYCHMADSFVTIHCHLVSSISIYTSVFLS